MDEEDPISQFFPGQEEEEDVLYKALGIQKTATSVDISKAYRKLALQYHPDKHSSSAPELQKTSAEKFQQVGFAYAILKEETTRKVYDATGRTKESTIGGKEEGVSWEDYFGMVFEEVGRKRLDDDKKDYQGSQAEIDDLKEAYNTCKGSLPEIMTHIPHSTSSADEARFITIINDLIASSSLTSTKLWKTTSTDKKASVKRKKEESKEAAEAEEAAREMGVWEEFYGDGTKGKRNKDKKKGGASEGDDEEGLRALMLRRNQQRGNIFENLEAKYGGSGAGGEKKTKKGGKRKAEENAGATEEIDDAAFEALQAKLFPKDGAGSSGQPKKKGRK